MTERMTKIRAATLRCASIQIAPHACDGRGREPQEASPVTTASIPPRRWHRRPGFQGKKRVPGLWVRKVAGADVYEVQKRVDGKMRRLKLRAKTKTDAINEARGLNVDLDRATSSCSIAASRSLAWRSASSSGSMACSASGRNGPSRSTGSVW